MGYPALLPFPWVPHSGHSGGDFVHQMRTPRSSPYGSRAQSDRSRRRVAAGPGKVSRTGRPDRTAGHDGRVSLGLWFSLGTPGENPAVAGDIRRFGRSVGVAAPSTGSPGHHNELRTNASRRRSRRVGDCDGRDVRPHPAPAGWRVWRCRAADRTCTTHQAARSQTRPARRGCTRRPSDRVSECATSAQVETRGQTGPGWGGSTPRSGTRSSPRRQPTEHGRLLGTRRRRTNHPRIRRKSRISP